MTRQQSARPLTEEPGATEGLAEDRTLSLRTSDRPLLYGVPVEEVEHRPTAHGLTVVLLCGTPAKQAVRNAIAVREQEHLQAVRAREKEQLAQSNARRRQQAQQRPGRRGGAA